MAETTADVALFQAVRRIPFARLKDIICRHYGVEHFDAERERACVRRGAIGCSNLYLYLSITYRLGIKHEAIGEIMSVYSDVTRMESVNTVRGETLTLEQTPQPIVEPTDLSVSDNTTVEASESDMELCDNEDVSAYMEAVKCNTTLSYTFDIGNILCYGSEEQSDENCEYEGGNWYLDHEEDQYPVSDPVQCDVTQRDVVGCQSVLEDDTVEKPKVVLYDE